MKKEDSVIPCKIVFVLLVYVCVGGRGGLKMDTNLRYKPPPLSAYLPPPPLAPTPTSLPKVFLSPSGPGNHTPLLTYRIIFFNDYFIYISIIYLGHRKYSLYVNKGWEVPGPRHPPSPHHRNKIAITKLLVVSRKFNFLDFLNFALNLWPLKLTYMYLGNIT